jgi:hypothetical protein
MEVCIFNLDDTPAPQRSKKESISGFNIGLAPRRATQNFRLTLGDKVQDYKRTLPTKGDKKMMQRRPSLKNNDWIADLDELSNLKELGHKQDF